VLPISSGPAHHYDVAGYSVSAHRHHSHFQYQKPPPFHPKRQLDVSVYYQLLLVLRSYDLDVLEEAGWQLRSRRRRLTQHQYLSVDKDAQSESRSSVDEFETNNDIWYHLSTITIVSFHVVRSEESHGRSKKICLK
jgi:hypothetical protein